MESPVHRLPSLALIVAAGCGIENSLIQEPLPPSLSVPPEVVNPVRFDRFVQATEPVVDVLFVVDNSSSMGSFQNILQQNFPLFMPYFVGSGLDYHIAMISTDAQRQDHSGKLRTGLGYRYIDEETPDPGAVFSAMTANLGVIVGSVEAGRASTYQAIELRRDAPTNEGFYRDEAELHVVFVSDDEDQSGANPVTRNEFLQWAANLKSSPDLVTMHAIVGLSSDPLCNSTSLSAPGLAYLTYASASGGLQFSICNQDWAPLLQNLGLQVAGLKREFFLTRMPVTSPEILIEVRVATTDPDSGAPLTLAFEVCTPETETESCQVLYNAGRNSITFLHYTPDPFAEVLVQYHLREEFAAATETDSF